MILRAERKDKLYHLDIPFDSDEGANAGLTPETMYKRLGHFSTRRIRRMGSIVKGLDAAALRKLPVKINCDACALAKSKRASFPPSEWETREILDLLHMDLAGPAEVKCHGRVKC